MKMRFGFAAFCLSTTAIALAPSVKAQTAPNTTVSQSDIDLSTPDPASKTKPGFGVVPRLGIGSGENYDNYLQFKQMLSDKYNLDVALDFSLYAQAATPDGGKPVWLAVYYPSLSWRPFTDTTYGSGKFDVTFGKQDYFNSANTSSQASRLGLITFPNDWTSDNFSWSTVAYTHTLPASMNWLSITVGQYNLFSFDPNTYAGNAQTTFIGYDFAQDATQTFPNAGLGSYLTAKKASFRSPAAFKARPTFPAAQSASAVSRPENMSAGAISSGDRMLPAWAPVSTAYWSTISRPFPTYRRNRPAFRSARHRSSARNGARSCASITPAARIFRSRPRSPQAACETIRSVATRPTRRASGWLGIKPIRGPSA